MKLTVKDPTTRHPRWTLAVVCMAIFMLLLDVTVVATALSTIETDLHTSLGTVQWVLDAYTLPLAGLLLTSAALGDRLGRRRLFLIGMSVFTLGSLACALAWSAPSLIIARAFQGLGATLLFAVALPLIGAAFPERRARVTAIGVFSATQAGATAVGPLLGGALVDGPGWRWIFLLNVPIGAAALVVGALKLTESRNATARSADRIGAALLTVALLALVVGLIRAGADGWTSAPILALFGTSAVLVAGFVVRELRTAEPMLDLMLFARRSFTVVSVSMLVVAGTLIALTNYLAIYLITTLGLTPLGAGVRFLAFTVAACVAAPLTARLSHRVPPLLPVIGGVGLAAAGMALMGRLDGTRHGSALTAGMILGGLGLGMVNASVAQGALAAVHHSRAGMATGVVNTMRQIGTAAGVALFGAVFQHDATAAAAHRLAGLHLGVRQTAELAAEVGSGAGVHVADAVPDAVRPMVGAVAREVSTAATNTILLLGAAITVAVVALAIAATLVRRGAGEPAPRRFEFPE